MHDLPSRREVLAGAAALSLLPKALLADTTLADARMLPSYLAARLNPSAAKWSSEIAALGTAERARERNLFVREKERELLGGFPAKTPLQARVVKTTARDGYRIENVMYQSRPDFWVTANLYLPTRGSGPCPAVLSPCGHYDASRMYPDYQLAYRNMVENGFAVLAFDPPGQGERRHFWNPNTNTTEQLGLTGRGSSATTEHSLACHFLELIGENINEYFVWDGMRGIDYLLTRPEVDAKRIACAGHSGGGTATMYLACADQRVSCVVIHEGGLGHQWPINLEHPRLEPADGEQNLFGAATYGMDFVELSAAISPRPLLISIEHFNPAFNAAAEDVKRRYELLDVADRFTTVEANAPHAWTKKLSIATVDWLSRHFYQRPGPADAPDYQPEPEEVLRCVPNGSLRYSGYDTIFIRTAKQAAALHPAPPRDVPAALRRLLRYRKPESPMAAPEAASGRVLIESEPRITLAAIVTRGAGQGVTVYLDDEGADAAQASGQLDRMAQRASTVVAVDVRGLGASKMTNTTVRHGNFVQIFDAETWAAYSAWQLEDSLLGMRVADTLRAVDYAISLPGANGSVRLVGKGMGALLALLGAALDPRIGAVVCQGGLLSYHAMAESDVSLQGADIVIRGVLKTLDLPDIAASIADRPLRIIEPVDAMKRPVAMADARTAYQRAIDAYARRNASSRFTIEPRGADF
jgi:cephalosporin-C deacetylase-like acetyl esterase